MQEEKIIESRIVNKHDTEENWTNSTTFIPKQGELIIYDTDDTYKYERFKIGDGIKTINELPFCIPSELLTDIDYNTTLAFDTTEVVELK